MVREHYERHIAEWASCSGEGAIFICYLCLLGSQGLQAAILCSRFGHEPSPFGRLVREHEITATPAENSRRSYERGPRHNAVNKITEGGLRGNIERGAMVHVGMDGIDEHHARNLLAM